jgi:hypothetical protein
MGPANVSSNIGVEGTPVLGLDTAPILVFEATPVWGLGIEVTRVLGLGTGGYGLNVDGGLEKRSFEGQAVCKGGKLVVSDRCTISYEDLELR